MKLRVPRDSYKDSSGKLWRRQKVGWRRQKTKATKRKANMSLVVASSGYVKDFEGDDLQFLKEFFGLERDPSIDRKIVNTMTEWEQTFLAGITSAYRMYGERMMISYKQLKILDRLYKEITRDKKSKFGEWVKEIEDAPI